MQSYSEDRDSTRLNGDVELPEGLVRKKIGRWHIRKEDGAAWIEILGECVPGEFDLAGLDIISGNRRGSGSGRIIDCLGRAIHPESIHPSVLKKASGKRRAGLHQ